MTEMIRWQHTAKEYHSTVADLDHWIVQLALIADEAGSRYARAHLREMGILLDQLDVQLNYATLAMEGNR